MSSLVILALMIIIGTRTAQSSKNHEIDSLTTSASSSSSNDVDFVIDDIKKNQKNGDINDDIKTNEQSMENFKEITDISSSIEDSRGNKVNLKKVRKHKAFFLDYPFGSQINRYHQALPINDKNIRNNYDYPEGRKKLGHKKRYQQESQIYYVKLPPTPYMYVPGLGYISQPPTYSTSGLQRPSINHHHQRPLMRPQNNYHKPTINNPFINVPVDFVSNGKPTGVYQWPDKKRPDSSLNSLNEGPYIFNGRPTSLYLLTADGQQTGHQPIRLADYSNNAYY